MDECLETLALPVNEGRNPLRICFQQPIQREGYHFLKIDPFASAKVRLSDQRITGILSVFSDFNKSVATTNRQSPPAGIGVEKFEFWLPKRRPQGKNLALSFDSPIALFGPEHVTHGPARPTSLPNACIADPADQAPALTFRWSKP
ncbi:MAG: hypothetical protein WAO78_17735, partial [Roseovarius sp.]